MSKIKAIFTKSPTEQSPEERMLARRFLFVLFGTAALILFIGFLIFRLPEVLEKTGPAAEIEELSVLVEWGFIGLAGFALLAMAFGRRYIYQILMLIATLAIALVLLYLGFRYGNLMMQWLGGAGFTAWIIGQGIAIVRAIKRILSGDDVLLNNFAVKNNEN